MPLVLPLSTPSLTVSASAPSLVPPASSASAARPVSPQREYSISAASSAGPTKRKDKVLKSSDIDLSFLSRSQAEEEDKKQQTVSLLSSIGALLYSLHCMAAVLLLCAQLELYKEFSGIQYRVGQTLYGYEMDCSREQQEQLLQDAAFLKQKIQGMLTDDRSKDVRPVLPFRFLCAHCVVLYCTALHRRGC